MLVLHADAGALMHADAGAMLHKPMLMLMLMLHAGALMHADADAGTGVGPVTAVTWSIPMLKGWVA